MKFVRRRMVSRKRKFVRRRRIGRRVPRPLKNLYAFKRFGSTVSIYHANGDAGNIWRIQDTSGTCINPYLPSGASWSAGLLAGTYANGFSLSFALGQSQNYTDFTALFDRYKLTGAKVTFLYQISEATAGGAQVLPTINYGVDYDDNAPPTSLDVMKQKQNTKRRILTANRPYSIFVKPRHLNTVLDAGGATSNVLSSTSGWLNCENPNVPHQGLKFWIQDLYSGGSTTTTIQSKLDISIQLYLKLKDPQ